MSKAVRSRGVGSVARVILCVVTALISMLFFSTAALANDCGPKGNRSAVKCIMVDTILTITGTGPMMIDTREKGLLGITFPWMGNEKKFTNVIIEDSVASISDKAFAGFSNLKSVTIPNSVTSIGVGVFTGCTRLTRIDVGDSNTVYSSVDGVLFNKAEGELIKYPPLNGQNEYKIPSNVISIRSGAFQACSSLISVTIPDGVTSIGYGAFRNCGSLTSVTIPNSVTSIGTEVFWGCSSLTSVIIPNSVTSSIENGTFYNCSGLTSVTIGSGVTSIGNGAFEGCTALTTVTIPNKVTSIGRYAFQDCTGLKSVMIPSSVTEIGRGAFMGCTNLKSVKISKKTKIEGGSFIGTSPYDGYSAWVTQHNAFDDGVKIIRY